MGKQLPAALVALAVAAVGLGCAQVSGGNTDGGGDPWYLSPLPTEVAAADVLLRVEEVGGFVDPATVVTRLPTFTVYGDGRVITPDPQLAIFPGPALPTLTVRRLPAGDIAAPVQAAVIAGVGDNGVDYGKPAITDMTSTLITVNTRRGVLVTDVYALRATGADGNLTAGQRAARQRLRDFIDGLDDLAHLPGVTRLGPPEPYQPVAVAAVAWPWTASSELPTQAERAWPGPALASAQYDLAGMACVTVTGDDMAAVLRQAAAANLLTPWSSAGTRWFVRLRPLLPDEHSCTDLQT